MNQLLEVAHAEEKMKSEPTTPENETCAMKNSSSKKEKRRKSLPSNNDPLPTEEIKQKFQQTDERLQEIERTHNLSAHNVKSILNRVVKNSELISKFNLFSEESDGILETTERSTRSKTKNDSVVNEIQFRPLNIPYCSLSHLSTEAFNYDESQDDEDTDYNPDNPVESVREQDPCSDQSDSESCSDESGSDILEQDDQDSELDDSLMFAGNFEPSDSEESNSCQQPSTSYATRSRAPNLNPDSLYPEENDLTHFFDHYQLADTDNSTDKSHCGFSPLNIPFCRFEQLDFDESQDDEDTDYFPQEEDLEGNKTEKREEFCTKRSLVEIPNKEVADLYGDILEDDAIVKIIPELQVLKYGTGPRKRELKDREPISKRWPITHVKPTAQCTAQSASCTLLSRKQNEITFLPDEYEQLRTQLEQHVQLLVQTVVITHHTPELNNYRNEYQTKINLMDEYYRKFGSNSFFNISNLSTAIDTCHDINNTKSVLSKHEIWAERCELNDHYIRPEACYVLSKSKALLYPELVPTQRPNASNLTTSEFTVVDNILLALGFMQFGHVPNAVGNSLSGFGRYNLISSNVLRSKTPVQIKDHMSKIRYAKNNPLYRLVANCEDGNPEITFRLRYEYVDGSMDSWEEEQLPMWYKEFCERFKALEKSGRTELQWVPPPDYHLIKKRNQDIVDKRLLIARTDTTLDENGIRRSKRRNREMDGDSTQRASEVRSAPCVKKDPETPSNPVSVLAGQSQSTNEADCSSVVSDLPSIEDQPNQSMEPLEPVFMDITPASPAPLSSDHHPVRMAATPLAIRTASSATTPSMPISVPPGTTIATPVPTGTRFLIRNANGEFQYFTFAADQVFMVEESPAPPVHVSTEPVSCLSTKQLIAEMTPAHSVEEFVILDEGKINFENDLHTAHYGTSFCNPLTPTGITNISDDIAGTSSATRIIVNDLEETYPGPLWDSPGADNALYDTIGSGLVAPKTPAKTILNDNARRQICISPADPKKKSRRSEEVKISPASSLNSIFCPITTEIIPASSTIVDESVSIWRPTNSTETASRGLAENCTGGASTSPAPKRPRNSLQSPRTDKREKQEVEEEENESSIDVASRSSLDVASRSSVDGFVKSRRKTSAPIKKIIEKPKRSEKSNRKTTTNSSKKTNVARNTTMSMCQKMQPSCSSSENKENNTVPATVSPRSTCGRRAIPEADLQITNNPAVVTKIQPSKDPRLRKRKCLDSTTAEVSSHPRPQVQESQPVDSSAVQDTLVVSPLKTVQTVDDSADGTSHSRECFRTFESRHNQPCTDMADVHYVLPNTSSCSVDVMSVGSHSNTTLCIPRTPMPRAMSETSQISPRTVSYSPIDEDTNLMIPRTPRPYGSQSPCQTSIPSSQRLTHCLKSMAQYNTTSDASTTHPFLTLYEDLERKPYSPEDIPEQEESCNIAPYEPGDSNLNKMSRVQKIKAGEEGMNNADYRCKQRQLLSRKIWSDVQQRLSMHADTWSKVKAIVQKYQADPEMQIAGFYDLLFEQHIDCLMLLTIFAPPDYLPPGLLHHPLRKPYMDAFEMLMIIDSYAEHKKKGSARAYFRTLSKTGANCSSHDICHHVKNIFGNDKPLWKKLKAFLPHAYDKEIAQENFENIDLTGSTGDEDDFIYEHLIFESQCDAPHESSNRYMQVIGESMFVQKGGNTIEVNVHCLKLNEEYVFNVPSTSTKHSSSKSLPSVGAQTNHSEATPHSNIQEQAKHFTRPVSPTSEKTLDIVKVDKPAEDTITTEGVPTTITNDFSNVQTNESNRVPTTNTSASAIKWTKEDDLELLNIYNNSEEEDENIIASEAVLSLKHPLQEIATRLKFLLTMFT